MPDRKTVTSEIYDDGYSVEEGVLTEPEIDELIDALERHQDGDNLSRNGRIFAVRNLLDLAEIGELAGSAKVRELAEAVLGERAFAVRGILFDKIPEANWKVPWHQDVTIATVTAAVKARLSINPERLIRITFFPDGLIVLAEFSLHSSSRWRESVWFGARKRPQAE